MSQDKSGQGKREPRRHEAVTATKITWSGLGGTAEGWLGCGQDKGQCGGRAKGEL
jgi:hypothetical protein